MSTVATTMPKRRGRPPKSRVTEPETEPTTPLRRGRPPKRSIPASEPDLEAPEQKQTQSQNRQDRATARKKLKRDMQIVEQGWEKNEARPPAQQTVPPRKTTKQPRRGRGKNKKTSWEENLTTGVATESSGVVTGEILQHGQVSTQMVDDYLNSQDSDNERALREDDAPNPIIEVTHRTDGKSDTNHVLDEYVDEETSIQISTEDTLHDDRKSTLSDQNLMKEIAEEDKACSRTGIGGMSAHQLAAFLVKRGESGEGRKSVLRERGREYMRHWHDKQAIMTGLGVGDIAVVQKMADKVRHSTALKAHRSLQNTTDDYGSPQVTHATKTPIDKHKELISSTHSPAKSRNSQLPQPKKRGIQRIVDSGDGAQAENEESNLVFNNPNEEVVSRRIPAPMLVDEGLDSVFDNPNEEVIPRGTFALVHMEAVDAFLDMDAVTDGSKSDADDRRNKKKTGLPADSRSPGTAVVQSSTPKVKHMPVYNCGIVVDFWLFLRSLESTDLELTQIQQRALEHVAPKVWSPFADKQLDYSSPTAKRKPTPLKRHFSSDEASRTYASVSPEPPGHYIWRMLFTKNKEQEGAVVHRIRQILLLLAWSRFSRQVPKWKENVLKGGGPLSPIRRNKDVNSFLSTLRKNRNAAAWPKRYRDLKVDTQWGAMYMNIVPPSMSALPSIEVPSARSIFIPQEGFEELRAGLDRDAQDVGFLAGEFGEGGVLLLAIVTPLVQMLEYDEGLGLLRSNGVTEALDHGYSVGIEQQTLEYGVTEVAERVVD